MVPTRPADEGSPDCYADLGDPNSLGDTKSVASWTHLAGVLVWLALTAVFSPLYIVTRLALHGGTIAPERASQFVVAANLVDCLRLWLLVGYIWLGIRRRGLRLAHLIRGKWANWRDLMRDTFFAVATIWVGSVLASVTAFVVMRATGWQRPSLPSFYSPTNLPGLLSMVCLSLSAGFCEELCFRGYLQRQFLALTKQPSRAVVVQAMLFGLAHIYQGPVGITMTLAFGLVEGAIAEWRKSLRPGMIAHALFDLGGTLARYLSRTVG